MRRWVSLGGCSGPSLMLTMLGLRSPEDVLPFDMVRCTFDGLIELTAKGFSSSLVEPPVASSTPSLEVSAAYLFNKDSNDGFFPMAPGKGTVCTAAGETASTEDASSATSPLPFIPDPVDAQLLFRSQHACFMHLDLNSAEVRGELRRQMRAWENFLGPLEGSSRRNTKSAFYTQPVTFVRTVMAEDPAQELEMLPQLHEAIRHRTGGQLPFRTVMVVHDQADATRPLCTIPTEATAHSSPCVVWNLKSSEGDGVPLIDRCHDGYQTILTSMCKEPKWRSLDSTLPSYAAYRQSRGKPFTLYTELSCVSGVPAVRGTCTGVGSTVSAALGRCGRCGCTDGHAVLAEQFDTHKPWTDADVDDLLMNYAMHQCDEVAAVEATARGQMRGANETWQRLRELLTD